MDQFQVRADDGVLTSSPQGIQIVVTGLDTPQRLWIISNPPMAATAGQPLAWTVKVDTTQLATAPDLRFALEGAPASMVLVTDAPNRTAQIT